MEVDVQYISKSYNWTAESETSLTSSSQFWTLFDQRIEDTWKFQSSREFELWPLRNRLSRSIALPVELSGTITNTEDLFTTIFIVNNSALSTSITGLGKFPEYEFHVLAFTVNGYRPVSPVKVVRTSEDGNTKPFFKLKGLTLISLAVREMCNRSQLYSWSRQLQ